MEVHVLSSLEGIDRAEWDHLSSSIFPFTEYHFLRGLEIADCLGTRTGWEPRYLTVFEAKKLVGAMPLYSRGNSYGEYIFDFAWANAFQAYRLNYYPKLSSAVPFTPATGTKLLIDLSQSFTGQKQIRQLLFEKAAELLEDASTSSMHALFIPEEDQKAYVEAGYFIRHTFQYQWHNRGYKTFDDFLAALTSKRRREIRRERAQVNAANIRIERLTAEQILPTHAKVFYDFYISTIDKMSSFDYLTPQFFDYVFREMKDRLLLVMAFKGDEPVAGALNYYDQQTLYGRNWGCLAEYKALHFELCYYQGLEFAIAKGLNKFEAGAQGEHKFQRGFLPCLTYSAHRVKQPQLDQAIRDHVAYEKKELSRHLAALMEHSPFTKPKS